ncbi:MAG: putative DNA modification/repair radical SAM protein [Planctomycetes bacterium]|nr:putative DNA modification/repair radical SAM protein [Planctomycetota bacterium]
MHERINLLGRSARFDLCGDCDLKGTGRTRAEGSQWHYPELTPDGKNSVMLRVLMSNRCENNCCYCENAACRDFPTASLTPDEIASHFSNLYRTNKARSLFLSSAVQVSTEYTMSRMVETLELVRFRYKIPAYIHCKILPQASDNLVERALSLATRVSVNLEVPNRKRMEAIGAPKDFDQGLYGRVQFIRRLLENPTWKRKSQTTQFIVGAAGETDKEYLSTMSHLYDELKLSRIYFSAFQKPGPVDIGAQRAPLIREHRLYQVDFLLRRYGFKAHEIPLEDGKNLSLREDPKTLWAKLHPETFPLEINRASRQMLLRVPGLGPLSVRRILKARREGKITSEAHLKELGIRTTKTRPYLLFDGELSKNAQGRCTQSTLLFA